MQNFKDKFLELAEIYARETELMYEQSKERADIKRHGKLANNAAFKIKKLAFKAYEIGVLSEIEDLLEHENKYIRCLAGSYCLYTNPIKAIATLEEIRNLPKPNYAGLQAYTSLHAYWRYPDLKPDKF